MLNQLGNIIVMGLAVRTDRWSRCVELFEHFNITEYTHYEMVRQGSGWRQYADDTLKMLSETPGTIVYLEDDFELIEGFEDALSRAVKDLPADWDILYLGCNPTTELHRVTPNLCRVMGAWGCLLYTSDAADE